MIIYDHVSHLLQTLKTSGKQEKDKELEAEEIFDFHPSRSQLLPLTSPGSTQYIQLTRAQSSAAAVAWVHADTLILRPNISKNNSSIRQCFPAQPCLLSFSLSSARLLVAAQCEDVALGYRMAKPPNCLEVLGCLGLS